MAGEDSDWALLYDTDLFFSVRIGESLARAGGASRTVRRLQAFIDALADRPMVALVNLAARGVEWREAIAHSVEDGIPLIAFGPHVAIDTQAEARRLGATTVVAYSQLMDDLPALVERTRRRASRRAALSGATDGASGKAPTAEAHTGE